VTAESGTRHAPTVSYVPETRFGVWFQRTDIWQRYVVAEAVAELKSLLPPGAQPFDRVLDAGCGDGVAFRLLQSEFGARELIGIDSDEESIARAAALGAASGGRIRVERADAAALPLRSASIDLVFCHQLLHHSVDPLAVLRECRRVLVPGGWLLISESCRAFLEWWPVRLLFRHPYREQHTAAQYRELVRSAGFSVSDQDWLTPAPWWSQRDLGLAARLGRAVGHREPTQVRIAARLG
jgi:SAM-dependent methyltransferase